MVTLAAAGLAIVAWIALPTQQGFVALAVIVVVGLLAVWNRPPMRDATGSLVRPTLVVRTALVVGLIAIPVGIAGVGLIGGRSAAPVVLAIGVAEFGLGALVLDTFAWVVARRATLAAIVAVVVAGIAAAWFTLPAFLDQLAGRNPF